MYLFFALFFLFLLFFFLINHFRKKHILIKLCAMSAEKKYKLLNSLIEPFGYCYDPTQDVFSSIPNAWQRKFGYGAIYDRIAARFQMVFDCVPVYFDYNGKTWLLEFWKGQYGINAGGEIGIYRANSIIPPKKRAKEIFHAVPDEEMPVLALSLYQKQGSICSRLNRRNNSSCPVYTGKERLIAHFSKRHWWLTAFQLGCFVWPYELVMRLCVTFPNYEMLNAFLNALSAVDNNCFHICVSNLQVCFTFDEQGEKKLTCWQRLIRKWAQFKSHLFCEIYLFVTRPFCSSMDRLLYLYYYLPFAFRRILRLRRFKRHRPKRQKTKKHKCSKKNC